MTDARKLLADYAVHGSEEAFREVVARHIDLVYSTAARLTDGDAHRAEDVAQNRRLRTGHGGHAARPLSPAERWPNHRVARRTPGGKGTPGGEQGTAATG